MRNLRGKERALKVANLITDPSVHYVKFMRGSTSAWDALNSTPEKISDDTLYFIYENQNVKKGKLYLGQKLISGVGEGGSNVIDINDLEDVYIDDEALADKQILVFNDTTNRWENASLSEIINTAVSEFVGATINSDGKSGLVPQPLAGDQEKFLRGDRQWVTIDIPTFDENIFTPTAAGKISIVGFEDALIGMSPIKTSNGLEWFSPTSGGSLNREIIELAELEEAVENQTADENTIFMVPAREIDSSNKYDEYMIIQGELERLGSFGDINLDNYVTVPNFTTAINRLDNILQDTENLETHELQPGLISRVTTIENNYVTKTEIGDLSQLFLSPGNNTLVEEVNTINDKVDTLSERLQWHELTTD